MHVKCGLLIALTLLPATVALAGSQHGLCIHETGCPWGGKPYPVSWVPCGTDINKRASDVCTIIEDGKEKVGRYTKPVPVEGPIETKQCGAALYEFTCLDF